MGVGDLLINRYGQHLHLSMAGVGHRSFQSLYFTCKNVLTHVVRGTGSLKPRSDTVKGCFPALRPRRRGQRASVTVSRGQCTPELGPGASRPLCTPRSSSAGAVTLRCPVPTRILRAGFLRSCLCCSLGSDAPTGPPPLPGRGGLWLPLPVPALSRSFPGVGQHRAIQG